MVTVFVRPTTRATHHAHSSDYIDTVDDLLEGTFQFGDYPQIGDGITEEATGRYWEVKRRHWTVGSENATALIVEVE